MDFSLLIRIIYFSYFFLSFYSDRVPDERLAYAGQGRIVIVNNNYAINNTSVDWNFAAINALGLLPGKRMECAANDKAIKVSHDY